jgi:hypothetical protein
MSAYYPRAALLAEQANNVIIVCATFDGLTMKNDLHSEPGLWDCDGDLSVSDAEILDDMIARLALGKDPPLTPDSIYSAFLEAKKSSDSWIKYYMIAVVLLGMVIVGAVTDFTVSGIKIDPVFIHPAAIMYFSVCTTAYTHHELKMRLFRAFFKSHLLAMNGPDRAQILLRYPLAFYGGEFLAWEARPKGFVVGLEHVLNSLPLLGLYLVGWVIAAPGLLLLLGFTLWGIFHDPVLSFWVKLGVFVWFFSALIYSGSVLRRSKKKHPYIFDETVAKGMQQNHRAN